MDPELAYAMFDWRLTDSFLEFLVEVTENEALCFRIADLGNEEFFDEEHTDSHNEVQIFVYGPKPISQIEANVFYRAVLDYEAAMEAKNHSKSA